MESPLTAIMHEAALIVRQRRPKARPGPYPGMEDREVVSFDGQLLILKWVNPEVAGRYGIMVLARCGSPTVRVPPRTP